MGDMACRRYSRSPGHRPSSARDGIRHRERRRLGPGVPPSIRVQAAAHRRRARYSPPAHYPAHDGSPLPPAPRRPCTAGHGPLHQRHDRQAQGRSDHAPANSEPGRLVDQSVGMASERPHPARATPPSRPWHHKCADLHALVRRRVRSASTLRPGRGMATGAPGRPDAVHGRAHHLRQAHRRMGGGGSGTPAGDDGGVRPVTLDGLRFGSAARTGIQTLAGDQPPLAPRAVRHDRDRHGTIKPAQGRA